MVVEVGFLVEKEEEEGGVEVVLLLEMEEEMEGRMVEELVEEMVVEMEGGRPKEVTASGCCRWFAVGEERREKKMKEKERKQGVYIRG